MKSAEEIETHIRARIESMLKYPLAYTDTPLGLESMVVGMIDVLGFVLGHELEPRATLNDWFSFAADNVGYVGARTVSAVMKDNNTLGNGWEGLTKLLRSFYQAT